MSIKRKDTPEARAFWEFVERTAQEVRETEPQWAKDARARREAFNASHVRVTCPDCGGRGYRSWVNQLGCVTCAGMGEWYEERSAA